MHQILDLFHKAQNQMPQDLPESYDKLISFDG